MIIYLGDDEQSFENRPEVEQYFKEAQRLTVASKAPAELRSLGKVLQRVMIGQKNVTSPR